MFVYLYIHTYMHAYIHTYIHTYFVERHIHWRSKPTALPFSPNPKTSADFCRLPCNGPLSRSTDPQSCSYRCILIYMHACMHAYIHIHTCVCVCVLTYVCMYVCVYVFMHTYIHTYIYSTYTVHTRYMHITEAVLTSLATPTGCNFLNDAQNLRVGSETSCRSLDAHAGERLGCQSASRSNTR